MGYELPAGLGVRLAQPGGEVYVFIGDGTYLMNPMELVTALAENLKVTVIISENHGYQCIRGLQLDSTGHTFGNEFRARDPRTAQLDGKYLTIDFAQNAASMGARTWQVRTPDELGQALREAREETRSCVIVAEVEKYRMLPGSGIWWDIEVAEVSQEKPTQSLRTQYEQTRRQLQKVYD